MLKGSGAMKYHEIRPKFEPKEHYIPIGVWKFFRDLLIFHVHKSFFHVEIFF